MLLEKAFFGRDPGFEPVAALLCVVRIWLGGSGGADSQELDLSISWIRDLSEEEKICQGATLCSFEAEVPVPVQEHLG